MIKRSLFVDREYVESLLSFHSTHDMSKGEFLNTSKDLKGMAVDTGCFELCDAKRKIGISRIPPSWFMRENWTALAPSLDLLDAYKSGVLDEKEYCQWFYRESLAQLDPMKIYRTLESKGFPVLLCYEKEGSFCHRHLVQEWLTLELLKSGLL